MEKEVLFKIGDVVRVNKTNEEGLIKDVVSVLGSGNNTYLVSVNNKDRMYMEDNLSLIQDRISVSEDEMEEVYNKIKSIICELGLINSSDKTVSMRNACRVHAYLTKKPLSDNANRVEGSYYEDLYNGLVKEKMDSLTCCYIFAEVLRRLGTAVYNVLCKDENEDDYVTNLVLLGNKYYYFDVNLEREIFEEEKGKDLVLCSAGIGSKRYNQFFTPLSLLNYNNTIRSTELPNNISEEDIDIEYVNMLI